MTTLTNSFEGGTNGTTITTGNSGGASGNAFDSVTTGTGVTQFSNTQVAHGTLSCELSTVAASTTFLTWSSSLTASSIATAWFRLYLYVTANPAAAFRLFTANTASTVCASLLVNTNGTLKFNNTSGTQIVVTTNTIPLNQWFRVEGFVTGSAASGQVSLVLYDTPDSITPTETQTSNTSQSTSGPITQVRYGVSASLANVGPYWMDDIGVSDSGALGPAFTLAPGRENPIPRRTPARAVVQFTPVRTTNASGVTATTSAGPASGVLPYAGGVTLQSFSQTFTSSGSWTAPAGIIGAPAVYAWGPSGTAATGTAGTGAGGGGGGSFGGEPALGGVTPGTVLTVTIGGGGSGTATTVTGGSVTVTGNAGGNASTGTGGAAGPASTNTIAFAGGAGGNGAAGGSGGGGGGGGSGGSTGTGGTGNPGSGASGGTGGTAGTGAAGLTGAAGGNGGTASNGAAGTAPGGAGGGGSGGATHTGGAATAGQAVIVWQVLTPVPMAMQRRALARARVQFTPVRTTNPIAVPAPSQQSRTWPRRTPARAYVRFTPVSTTNNTAFVAVPAPVQQPRPAPRRTPARAFIQFRPVRTMNAAPPVILGTPPTIPTSGGDRSPTIRVYREIRPGDVPSSGAQLPKLTGRAFAVPIPVDTDHATHAWDEAEEEVPPVPSGPSLLDQARTELDELAKAARDAADAIDRAADRARPIVEGIGSKAYDLGKIFGSQPYDPRPRKVCGAVHMAGGVTLTCQRKPHDDGWHSDKGLHWR